MVYFTQYQTFPKIPKFLEILKNGQKFLSRDKITKSVSTGNVKLLTYKPEVSGLSYFTI